MARVYFDKRTNWWCMDYKNACGQRRQVKAPQTKAAAEIVLRRTLDTLAVEKATGRLQIRPKAFDELANEYIEYTKSYKTPESARRDQTIVKNLLSAFENKMLSQINIRDIEEYQTQRSSEVAKSIVNRELECLKHMFTKAIEWGYVIDNPVK
jgi:hypothetical protein